MPRNASFPASRAKKPALATCSRGFPRERHPLAVYTFVAGIMGGSSNLVVALAREWRGFVLALASQLPRRLGDKRIRYKANMAELSLESLAPTNKAVQMPDLDIKPPPYSLSDYLRQASADKTRTGCTRTKQSRGSAPDIAHPLFDHRHRRSYECVNRVCTSLYYVKPLLFKRTGERCETAVVSEIDKEAKQLSS